MTRILVSDAISQAGLSLLRSEPSFDVEYAPGLSEAELLAKMGAVEGLVIRSASRITARVIAAGAELRVIGRAGIGVDNVDLAAAAARNIVVMNTPHANIVSAAEHALAVLFAVARRVPQASSSMKAGKWEKSRFTGREVTGKTLGILGLGNIGSIVADRAKGLRMRVIAYDPGQASSDRAAALGVELAPLHEVLREADFITAHTPLTRETEGMLGDAEIAQAKRGVILVNCARGGVFDEGALLRGLQSGQIGGVGLDVFVEEPPPADHPLLAHEHVVVTPHLGASTVEAQERVSTEIAEQIVAFFTRGVVTHAVRARG